MASLVAFVFVLPADPAGNLLLGSLGGRVSCKSANGLDDDQVDCAVQCVLDHLFEAFTVGDARSGDTFVCIDINVILICYLADHVLIIGNLCFIAAL